MANFGDLLKTSNTKVQEQNNEISIASADGIMPMMTVEPMALDYTVYDLEPMADESWTRDTEHYRWFDELIDTKISTVDGSKNINLDPSQINITQEEHSQYIPFEMPRHYDGYDLTKAKLSIHYDTSAKENNHGVSDPVNVQFTSDKIKFGWLVDGGATTTAGKLEFEIHATGVIFDTKGNAYSYNWKTKPNGDLNVLQSICSKYCENIVIDDTWLQNLIEDVVTTVTEQITDINVGEQVTAANEAADRAQGYAEQALSYSEASADAAQNAVNQTLANYATIKFVEDAVAGVDVTEQLKEYAKTSEVDEKLKSYYTTTDSDAKLAATLEKYATKDDVATAVDEADISDKLNDYYKRSETYNQEEIDNKVANVKVDLTGYATETFVTTKTDALSTEISGNKTNISSLSNTVKELQNEVNSIDKTPGYTYDIEYNDSENPDVGENTLTLFQIEKEGTSEEIKEVKKKIVITGGSGSGTSSSLKIGYITTSPLVITLEDKAIIKYSFSGTDSSGDNVTEGTATWKVAGRVVATNIAVNGDNEFDITEYITIGTNKVNLSIQDEAGSLVSKTWTVQKIDVRLESTFNDKLTYPLGVISFDYTPYGAIEKDVYFVLDGEEIGKITTSSSGIPMAYELPAQEHGSHLLDVCIKTTINGNDIESNHIKKDIMWKDPESSVPIISSIYQNFTARQYDTTNIEYTVNDPNTETPTVTIAVDGNVVSTSTLTSNTSIYPFKTDKVGSHIITITCGETVKTLIANITKLDINVTPITAGLAFDFNPTGKSNNDTDRLWTDGTTSMSVSENFDWINGGYQIDENGDQYFCIKAGTNAEIDYKLFADDAKRDGKEFKMIYKVTNVANSNARFLHCMDNTTGSDYIGIEMFIRQTNVYGAASEYLKLFSTEEELVELEFNINKSTEAITELVGYENGVPSNHRVYDDSFNFTQNTPKVITLGSSDCDLHIYRFKVYKTSLSGKNVLNNYIADATNADEMIRRYNENQIYDENGALTAETLADKCKQLRVIKVESPYFTNKKSDKRNNTIISHIYKNGRLALDNWVARDVLHSGQGTSSDNYGGAARNLDLILRINKDFNNTPEITLGDGTKVTEVSLTDTSIPVDYLNVKVNVASSNMVTNALIARWYNRFNPYKRSFVREDQSIIPYIKDTMEFYPCVVFIKESDTNISTHREFADTDWHFYSMGCVGDSKKTDETRLTDPSDPYECIIEIMDVELPLSDFPKDTMMNAMGYKEDETTKEKIYTWAKDENLGILYELIDGEYILTEDETVDLNKTYYVDILLHDDFSEDYTYGWRYISDDKNSEVVDFCKQKWIEFYKFVTESTDEEFISHIEDYVVLDSMLYYYLFTTHFTLVDNRAKNSFWHYGWSGEYDESGEKIRKWSLDQGYDFDTAMGLNNYGDLVYRYGYEDTDVLDGTNEEVFRESDSTFFCRLRDLFNGRMKTMYNQLESQGAWNASALLEEIKEFQSMYPPALWHEHTNRVYVRSFNSTHINGKGDDQFLRNMAHGKCWYPFVDFLRNQQMYMASKHQTSFAANDNATLRCTVPSEDVVVPPNYRLKLTPYSHMYLNVQYGTSNIYQVRCTELGKEYEIPFTGNSTDIMSIFSSSNLTSLGDLSTCYPATVSTSNAKRIKTLTVGNKTDGYDNPYLTTLTLGANYLLEELNLENVSGFTQSLNLSVLHNLKELYAHGTNTSGVTFADGGLIEIAELPAINSMTMKNLKYLSNLDITSFEKLTTLTVENCASVDLVDILNKAQNVNRVRITDIDWSLEDTSLLNRIYKMAGMDKTGYNIDNSVLTGKVFVPVVRQQELHEYNELWKDLEVTYNTLIEQFPVTFINEDGTVLDVQYIDKGSDAVDPITREIDPIPAPTKESTISHIFTFDSWDIGFESIYSERTITATYTSKLREYTILYKSKGTILQTSKGLYGENIPYTGDIPIYTLEESGHTYNLFKGWDKSGIINGDKTVNAVFDTCTYVDKYFEGKELSTLRPVEIYMMKKMELIDQYSDIGDYFTITFGSDYEYDDIESDVFISEKKTFNGSNYLDTNVNIMDEDKDFVLAIDYLVSDNIASQGVLAQCFQDNGSIGFKLWNNNGIKLTWGNTSHSLGSVNSREMIILRHVKGEKGLHVYHSNLENTEPLYIDLDSTKTPVSNASLVFGCGKRDDGKYQTYGNGSIYWAKIWHADIGDSVCKELSMWTHESVKMEKYTQDGINNPQYQGEDSSYCSASFLAASLLNNKMTLSSTNDGWGTSSLKEYMNTRMYNSINVEWRQLIKKVLIPYSTISVPNGDLKTACYLSIPALHTMISQADEFYTSETKNVHASHISTSDTVIRRYENGNAGKYWTRSINKSNQSYAIVIQEDGTPYRFEYPYSKYGILLDFSI